MAVVSMPRSNRRTPLDRFLIVGYPARGDEPWLILVVHVAYSALYEPKAISFRHLEQMPADQAGNKFASEVNRRRTLIEEKYDRECEVIVDMTQYSHAQEQFKAINDARYYRVKTGDNGPESKWPCADIGRNYVLDGIRNAIQQGVFLVELPAEDKATFSKAMTDTMDKPPKIEPQDALISDASTNERMVIALGLALEVAYEPPPDPSFRPLTASSRNPWLR